ncbi:MAG: hypothetical protein ABFD94_05545 [Armatimonadia bacterium]
MPAKPSTKPSIPELAAPEASEHSRLYRTKAFPFVSEGSVYCFGLREHLVKPTIARGESAISALLALPSGNVYGLTCGEKCHLFYFHPGFGVAHTGAVSESTATGGALLQIGDQQLLGGWHGPDAGGLFRHDATAEMGQGMEQFRGAKSPIEPLALPAGTGGVMALAGPVEGVAYALTTSGALVAVDCATGKTKTVARVAAAAPALVALPDGHLLGAFAEGQLWQYSPSEARLTALEAHAPCQKGKRYVAGVQSLIAAEDGLVYGGTSVDGYLFTYSQQTGAVINLGKPNRQSNVRALAQGRDGFHYGLVEEQQGMAHLFRYSPDQGFTDLGLLCSAFPEYWIAHSLSTLSVGPNGELFGGESDDISHLFIYYPPVHRTPRL